MHCSGKAFLQYHLNHHHTVQCHQTPSNVFPELDNSKLASTQQQNTCWHWHVARIISSLKIYGLYGLKHHIVEIRGDVTMRDGRTNERTTEDRATQPMETGGWVSQFFNEALIYYFHIYSTKFRQTLYQNYNSTLVVQMMYYTLQSQQHKFIISQMWLSVG